MVARIDDRDTRAAVIAERAFLGACGGGCHTALGALGTVMGNELTLQGQLFQDGELLAGEVSGSAAAAEQLGQELAKTISKHKR
jgi:hydroxymethylbilane synthase